MIAVIFWILIPFCITIIYNYFYNKHINKQINSDQKKAWLSPFIVFFIVLAAELLLIVILVYLLSVDNKVFEETSYQETCIIQYNYKMYYEAQLKDSIYSIFDGKKEVKGYIKTEGEYNNFKYTLYTNTYDLNISPQYILITDYIGNEKISYGKTQEIIRVYSKGDSFIKRGDNFAVDEITMSPDPEFAIYDGPNKTYHIIDMGEYPKLDINLYVYNVEQDYAIDNFALTLYNNEN